MTKFGEDELKLDWGDDDDADGATLNGGAAADDDDANTKSDSEVERSDKLKGASLDGDEKKKPELIMVSAPEQFVLHKFFCTESQKFLNKE